MIFKSLLAVLILIRTVYQSEIENGLNSTELIPWVVGITDNCVVYEYMLEKPDWNLHSFGNSKNSCANDEVFLMKYQNENKTTATIAVAIRIVGSRLEIQNALSGKKVMEDYFGSAHIFKINYRERFLTNSLPAGYVFQKVFHVGFKVYCLVRTKTDIRFHRLKFIMQDVNTPKFYLTTAVKLQPAHFPPSAETGVEIVNVLASASLRKYSDDSEGLLACPSSQLEQGTLEAVALYLTPKNSNSVVLASVFLLSSIQLGIPHYKHIPKVSMIGGRYGYTEKHCDKNNELNKLLGFEKQKSKTYFLNRSKSSQHLFDIPERHTFKNKLFNPSNFHNRMAYPHAVYYNPLFNRDHIPPVDRNLLPLFVGSCLGIFLLSKATFIILKFVFMMYYGIFRQSVEENVRKYKGKT